MSDRGIFFSSMNRRRASFLLTSMFSPLLGSKTLATFEIIVEKTNPPSSMTKHATTRSEMVVGTMFPYPTVVTVCTAQYMAPMYISQWRPSIPL